ncbi:ABC transporter ATP-binding protein [Arthrobacter caoxuetaonis]|uniref:Spermidine/putrescine import ATP-binding protein PotA n=1 Tax=Arthrobacter caoxuetaonis TaxID=2886935 RepID=A0A9X1SC84_9MICC|nr:ABC transporter ATP-binding protein [Arthrobacter caoxuetaonis]MCC3297416.1 ABC transporter ATP-binding protein [Arthrobacter caoxuetaonis]USQ58051.1 ABC transporter ATP-binding protein [Arthrobacter caoxuetaonis]
MSTTELSRNPGAAAEGSGADLVLSGITKRFTEFTAVDNLDLVIPSGSFFALLGPSGCGKTTTLRMVAGLEQPTAGSISIGGKDITGTSPYQRPVNTVFQNYALFPHMSVLDNVSFGLKRRKVRDAEVQAKAALELVELGHLAARRPAQLSGGQQQRVALARAVVNRPAVLLLDEPLGALDMKLRRQMQVELKKIQTEVGLTFVHVTHDQEEAMTMADTVAVMNHGKVEQMGPPQELYELPRTAFVANFLGKSNLMPATVTGDAGEFLRINIAGNELTILKDRAADHSGKILVGIRPEKLSMVGESAAPAEGSIRGVVLDASFTGASTEYLVDAEGIGTVGVFSQNHGGALFDDGDKVRLAWDPAHAFGLSGSEDREAGAGEDGL